MVVFLTILKVAGGGGAHQDTTQVQPQASVHSAVTLVSNSETTETMPKLSDELVAEAEKEAQPPADSDSTCLLYTSPSPRDS